MFLKLASPHSCHAGFIAMYATLASRDVDCCLIPESPFYLEGPGGLFEFIEKRLKEHGHMVIVMAEGAGQELLSESIRTNDQQDASGNKLLKDVGLWILQRIKDHFKKRKMAINLKYIGHFSRQWLALQMCSCDSWNAIMSFCRRLNKNE
ncbi:hypothetical protein CMV_007000 [Castanea mollissima]|uniref:Phosphofructokinase domain-containing protein n=1 Tax=Castanea mollissima TaxID=60419 RepID=A0A8J4RUL1_9ROSI|nr:hypothetical protein CMV_007000 [Castanea mollissima]